MADTLSTNEKVRLYKLFGDEKSICFHEVLERVLNLCYTKSEIESMELNHNIIAWQFALLIKDNIVEDNKIPEFLMASEAFISNNQDLDPKLKGVIKAVKLLENFNQFIKEPEEIQGDQI